MNSRIIFTFTIIISTFICSTTSENNENGYLCYCIDQAKKDKFCALEIPSIDEIILIINRNTRADLSTGLLLRNYLKATNMLAVKWDEELAKKAQQYANDCPTSQDMEIKQAQNGFYYVQNFAIKEYNAQPGSIENVVKSRYLRFNRVLKEWKREPKFGSEERELDGKSNRTNIMRSSTWKVGCGIGVSAKENEEKYREHYVCYYETGEVNDGKPLYKLGCELCNDCPVNTTCDKTDYVGLCHVESGIPNISFEVDDFHDVDSCMEVEETTALDQTLIWQCNSWKSQNCIIKEMCDSSWNIQKHQGFKIEYCPFQNSIATFLFYKKIYLKMGSCYSFKYKVAVSQSQVAIIGFPVGNINQLQSNVTRPEIYTDGTLSLYLPWKDTPVQVGVSVKCLEVETCRYAIRVEDFKIKEGNCPNTKK